MRTDSVRGGDAGLTSLGDGSRIPKDSERVAAYGAIDELDAFTGLARATVAESVPSSEKSEMVLRTLAAVQHSCWILAAHLADPRLLHGVDVDSALAEISDLAVEVAGALEPLTSFVSPGASRAEAAIHVARTVCRRAERHVVALCGIAPSDRPHREVMILNRMSALLFDVARLVLDCQGQAPSLRGDVALKRR